MARARAWALAGLVAWTPFFLIGFIPGTWMYPIPVPVRIGVFFVASAACYGLMFRKRRPLVRLVGGLVLGPLLSAATGIGLYVLLNFVLLAMG